jgi:hypothetical protein
MAARFGIITRHLSSLAATPFGDLRWFFADVPLETDEGQRECLELAIQHRTDDRVAHQLAHTWLELGQADGLIATASPAATPLVLQASLFPGGIVPPFYPVALAIGSLRAAASLRSLVMHNGIYRAPDWLVREELAATYRALVPNRARRLMALEWHVAWVESIAARAGCATPNSPSNAGCHEPSKSREPPCDYASLRRSMERQIARIAAGMGAAGTYTLPTGVEPRAAVRAALIARLAHTQVVRLLAPGDSASLRLEAALLRSIGDE